MITFAGLPFRQISLKLFGFFLDVEENSIFQCSKMAFSFKVIWPFDFLVPGNSALLIPPEVIVHRPSWSIG
jgi:hypothetical protein